MTAEEKRAKEKENPCNSGHDFRARNCTRFSFYLVSLF